MSASGGRIAVVFRDGHHPGVAGPDARLEAVFAALRDVGFRAEQVEYRDEAADEICQRLHQADAVLVWVDPVTDGQDRRTLDHVLREVAASGVLVSAHPDVIVKMGTKDVLYRTRGLSWATDTHLYRTLDDFRRQFPERLAASGPRVLKQVRGNGGEGVWKVQLLEAASQVTADSQAVVRVQHARIREAVVEELPLRAFMRRCDEYFSALDGAGCLIDQAFQPRIMEGLIRCYLVQKQVVGFARQYARGHSPAEIAGGRAESPDKVFGLPSQKTMYGPQEPAFQALRRHLEDEWLPGLQDILDLSVDTLPLLWDADFLFGELAVDGQDTYVLCEINVSCVIPFPPEAPAVLAQALASLVGS